MNDIKELAINQIYMTKAPSLGAFVIMSYAALIDDIVKFLERADFRSSSPFAVGDANEIVVAIVLFKY